MILDFDLSDQQPLIQETARDLVDNEVIPKARDSDRAEKSTPSSPWRLGDMGYPGGPVAEEYGGRGLDYTGYGLIVEEVGRAAIRRCARSCRSRPRSSAARSSAGDPRSKSSWLPKLTADESFAMTPVERVGVGG